jgi:hypothetical protein
VRYLAVIVTAYGFGDSVRSKIPWRGLSNRKPKKESLMPILHADDVNESHLRFVFADAVVSFPLAEAATFQDVALKLRDLMRRNHGELVSIVVVLKSDEATSADFVTA